MSKLPLSSKTIAEFERRLREVGCALEAAVAPRDGAELDETLGTEVSGFTRTRLAVELRRVEAALLRISQGRFGRCGRCTATIEKERLRADPAVQHCTACADHDRPQARRPSKRHRLAEPE